MRSARPRSAGRHPAAQVDCGRTAEVERSSPAPAELRAIATAAVSSACGPIRNADSSASSAAQQDRRGRARPRAQQRAQALLAESLAGAPRVDRAVGVDQQRLAVGQRERVVVPA